MLHRLARVAFVIAAAAGLALPGQGRAADAVVSGAGSTNSALVYRVWGAEYARVNGGTVAYDPVGSEGGMAKIIRREVDFAACDVFASAADLKKNDLVMFPTAVSGLVPVVNLAHVGANALHLNGDVLARIFLHAVTRWDAPEIQALNPELKLPARPIRLVVRSDAAAATWLFSDYLSRASDAWRQQRGVASRFDWPAGALAAKSTGESAALVRATPDSIGYVNFNYVADNELTPVAMTNSDGRLVTAGVDSFREAVTRSAWQARGDFSATLSNLPGAGTWPMTTAAYVVMPRVAPQGARTEQALRFITWAYLHGDALARQAKFVPLPDKVQASAYREIAKITGAAGEPIGARAMSGFVR
jgi:phosphate transport system substrate-binding protein